MPLGIVQAIKRRIQYVVQNVVARGYERDGEQTESNAERQCGSQAGGIETQRDNHTGKHEYVLEPVIDAEDLEVTSE